MTGRVSLPPAACVVLLSFGVSYFGGHRARENARRATQDDAVFRNPLSASSRSIEQWNAPSAAPSTTDSMASNNLAQERFAQRLRSEPEILHRNPQSLENSAGASAKLGTSNNIAADLPSTLRRVHKEARIGVGVARVEDSSEAVEAMVKSAGGFVLSNALTTGGNGLKSANLSLRVPVGQFETVLSRIAKLGTVRSKNVAGEDITERFSDADQAERVLNSELSVKESMLQAALQREKEAQKKKDSYRVSWQQRADVRQLRIQAAQARARLELLKKVSELSNIEVELNEKPAPPQAAGFTEELGRTSREAFASFAIAVRVPINILIWILAYAPLWLPLILIYRFATKHYVRGSVDG